MPSKLAPPTINFRRQQRALAAQFLRTRQIVTVGPPWEGFVPDLPHHLLGLNSAEDWLGLVVKSDPQRSGEVLTTDAGWNPVDEPRLGASLPSLHANSGRNVVLLKNFPLVTSGTKEPSGIESPQTLMLVDGNDAAAGSCQLYRLDPVTAQWVHIAFNNATATGGLSNATAPLGTIDGDTTFSGSFHSMPDATTFALGAANRALNNVDQPVFVFTNNRDPVMIYPRLSGTLEFQPLTDTYDQNPADNDGDFRCVSVATFNDRVYFLNTYEAGVRHRARLRRTARSTAALDPITLGDGFIDLEQFEGNGVSIRPLGNVLAAYFEDGVAFVRDTGDQAIPNAVQYLDVQRGLLSTHSVVGISNNQHFGIFDDGWWILDSNGRWREVGVAEAGGKPVVKWKDTFYKNLDLDQKHRIYCYYDRLHNWVRIVIPRVAEPQTTEVWIYDIDADRVFPDRYTNGITVWGDVIVYDSTASRWVDQTDIWADIQGTWASFTPPGDVSRIAHGNQSSFVYFHDDNLQNRDGVEVSWLYQTVLQDFGNQARLKTTERLITEYVNSNNANSVSITMLDEQGNSASESVVLNDGTINQVFQRKSWNRITSGHIGFQISGQGPVRLRQFQFDYFLDEYEPL